MVHLIRLIMSTLLMIMHNSDLVHSQCYCGGGACSGASACRSHCLCCGRCPPPPPPTPPPTRQPTNAPSTKVPTAMPTRIPTYFPTYHPSQTPTTLPSDVPSDVPTNGPTIAPTGAPTNSPSYTPTDFPSSVPSRLDVFDGSSSEFQASRETSTDTTTAVRGLESSSAESSVQHIPMFMYFLVGGLSLLVFICTACYCHKRHQQERMKQTSGLLDMTRGELNAVSSRSGDDDLRSMSVINPAYRTIKECLTDEGTTYEVPGLVSPRDLNDQSVTYLVPTGTGVNSDTALCGKVGNRTYPPSTLVVTSNILSMDNYVDPGHQSEDGVESAHHAYESVGSTREHEYAGFPDSDCCTQQKSTEA
eukprot:m.173278 g.173278  ORF g.173278 m.173278 type:complete len:361 (-) comp18297_c0_seq1:105-1187(-)